MPSASGPKAACVPTGQTPHPVLCCLLSHFISLIPRPRAFLRLQLGGRGAVLAKVRAARPVIQVHAWRHLPFGPSDAGTDGQYAASKNSVPITGPGVDHYAHAQARAHAHSYSSTRVHLRGTTQRKSSRRTDGSNKHMQVSKLVNTKVTKAKRAREGA